MTKNDGSAVRVETRSGWRASRQINGENPTCRMKGGIVDHSGFVIPCGLDFSYPRELGHGLTVTCSRSRRGEDQRPYETELTLPLHG